MSISPLPSPKPGRLWWDDHRTFGTACDDDDNDSDFSDDSLTPTNDADADAAEVRKIVWDYLLTSRVFHDDDYVDNGEWRKGA